MIFGIVTERMTTSPDGPSNMGQVQAWISSENAPNTWVHETGPDLASGIEGAFMSGRETYFVVQLSTMQIMSKFSGNEKGALADLKSRL